jgi:hypothetical protein
VSYCSAQFRVTQKINCIVLQCAIQSDAEKSVGCATTTPTPTPTPFYLRYSQISQHGRRILPSDRRMEFSPKKTARDISIFSILEFCRTWPPAPSRLRGLILHHLVISLGNLRKLVVSTEADLSTSAYFRVTFHRFFL